MAELGLNEEWIRKGNREIQTMPVRLQGCLGNPSGARLFLATLAARSTENADATIAELLTAIGWVSGNGAPLTPLTAGRAAWDTK